MTECALMYSFLRNNETEFAASIPLCFKYTELTKFTECAHCAIMCSTLLNNGTEFAASIPLCFKYTEFKN